MKGKLISSILFTLASLSTAHAGPVVINNSPFEINWLKSKQEIQKFSCKSNENCALLSKILDGIKYPSGVNTAINKFMHYKSEKIDYWDNPDHIYNSRQGDCEDIVIAKVVMLRELGFDMNKVDVQLMHRDKGDVWHLSLTYDGERMDYQNLSDFQTVFSMKVNQKGLYVNTKYVKECCLYDREHLNTITE